VRIHTVGIVVISWGSGSGCVSVVTSEAAAGSAFTTGATGAGAGAGAGDLAGLGAYLEVSMIADLR
jgi:hypothetical protein